MHNPADKQTNADENIISSAEVISGDWKVSWYSASDCGRGNKWRLEGQLV